MFVFNMIRQLQNISTQSRPSVLCQLWLGILHPTCHSLFSSIHTEHTNLFYLLHFSQGPYSWHRHNPNTPYEVGLYPGRVGYVTIHDLVLELYAGYNSIQIYRPRIKFLIPSLMAKSKMAALVIRPIRHNLRCE